MTLCAKPVAEKCALDDGHAGECRCRHERAVAGLGNALVSLVREVEATDANFHLRKAARVARRAQEREVVTAEDLERSEAEKAARRDRRRAADERDRQYEGDPSAFDCGEDGRGVVRVLFANLKAALPELEKLLARCSGEWGYDDPLYRLYHQSYKVYWLQEATREIVAALQALAPDCELDEWFTQIVRDGPGAPSSWATTSVGSLAHGRSSRPSSTRATSSRWPCGRGSNSTRRRWCCRAGGRRSCVCMSCGEGDDGGATPDCVELAPNASQTA